MADKIRPGEIIGRRVDGEPANELEHFIVCPSCGQMIDRRDLGQVIHHDEPGHAPLPVIPMKPPAAS